MLTFFHSWRRTLLFVTLVMTCAFMTAWLRSGTAVEFWIFVVPLTLLSAYLMIRK